MLSDSWHQPRAEEAAGEHGQRRTPGLGAVGAGEVAGGATASSLSVGPQSRIRTPRSRSELAMTLTDDSAMVAAAMTEAEGLSLTRAAPSRRSVSPGQRVSGQASST